MRLGTNLVKCIGCEDINNFNNSIIVGTKEIKYWQELNEEYSIPFDEATDDILEWAKKEREQSKYLIDTYAESAWNIQHLMEVCRSEEISESFFRQLVRCELDKVCKNGQ